MSFPFRNSKGARQLRKHLKGLPRGGTLALVAKLGVHRNALWHWSSGVRRPGSEFREALEVFCGIPRDIWRTSLEREASASRLRAA